MTLLFQCPWPDKAEWLALLEAALPGEVIVEPGDGFDPLSVDIALSWAPPAGFFEPFKNLQVLLSLGAGIDHLLGHRNLPAGVIVGRAPDPALATRMADYVLAQILAQEINLPKYAQAVQEKSWPRFPRRDPEDSQVAILGLGLLGAVVAGRLQANGFKVSGWRRGDKPLAGVTCYHGPDGWQDMIARADYVVCLLPLTPETENIVDRSFIETMKPGSYLINCARGGHVVDQDLIAALDQGHLSGATLDVFRQEPLPDEHPFWRHPKIMVTPHISSPSAAASCVAILASQVTAFRHGEALPHQVDLTIGY